MTKLFLLLSFFICETTLAKEVWVTGEKSFVLYTIKDLGFVSESCLKECELKTMAKKTEEKLKGMTITGGKDPASVLCKLLKGKVLFLSDGKREETFCFYQKDIMSLSLLL